MLTNEFGNLQKNLTLNELHINFDFENNNKYLLLMNRRFFTKIFGSSALLLLSKFNSSAKEKGKDIVASTTTNNNREIEPKLSDTKSSSIVFVGDIQRYCRDTVTQPIASMMFAWIAKTRKQLNTKCALFAGDLVEFNEEAQYVFTDRGGDCSSKEMWQSVSDHFARLDNKVAYIACTGNHDYGRRNIEDRNTHFNEIFNTQRNRLSTQMLRGMCENKFGVPTFENAVFEVDLGGKWGRVMVFSIEFSPRKSVLEWVHKKATTEFANKTCFLLLHDYINMDGEFTKANKRYKRLHKYPEDIIGGEDVWNNLVKKTPNLRLVLNGHASSPIPTIDANSAFRVDKNDAGKNVYSMVFAMHGDRRLAHGCDGWLRILEFLPDGKTVKVMTFSPYLFYSWHTKDISRADNAKNQFTFEIS